MYGLGEWNNVLLWMTNFSIAWVKPRRAGRFARGFASHFPLLSLNHYNSETSPYSRRFT